MKYISLLLLLYSGLVFSQEQHAGNYILQNGINGNLNNTHDLTLPDWGPYSRKYAGISHISDKKQGMCFELTVFPGYFRRKIYVPSVRYETEFHPWEASSDLSYYSYRHELEWKDKVYCDVSFSEIDNSSRLITAEFVNNSDQPQNLVLHYMGSMEFPPEERLYLNSPFKPALVSLPEEEAVWIDAVDYKEIYFAQSSPADNLVHDGFLRGEIRANGFVGGSALGKNFGKNKGDFVRYEFELSQEIKNPVILFRYKLPENQKAGFIISGFVNSDIEFEGNGNITNKLILLPLNNLSKGKYTLTLTSKGESQIMIDGFVITGNKTVDDISFKDVEWSNKPEIIKGPDPNSTILKYPDAETYYGIAWENKNSYEIRQLFCDELEGFLNKHTTTYNTEIIRDNEKTGGHYTNIYFRPLIVEPNSLKIIHGFVCEGNKDDVINKINDFNNMQSCETIYQNAKSHSVKPNCSPEGSKYLFSQQLVAAVTLTNIIYPIYTKRNYIKAFVPGKYWDCLYTWDAGFTDLGLTEINIDLAVQNLNTYLTEPGDIHNAFIHHGTPVPTQIYSFLEIWNKTQDRKLLEYFYPRLKQYYLFLAGKMGGSTTRMPKSNLISTWDYFYNTGWDDYPPQVFVYKNKLKKIIAPVCMTAHCIRIAKILEMAAQELGLSDDIAVFDEDIKTLSESLQKYSWDSSAGYFGYVVHDDEGNPKEILKYESGVNFNMGLDGVYPIITGMCTQEQQKAILNNLMSENKLWTPVGISIVEMAAPYYKKDGYCNGSVLFPHEWLLWKAMLDLGEDEFAYKIAHTALDTWKKETEATYNCPEHFEIESARGIGWQQISGFNCTVMSWFAAYYIPGNLTCGFDTWIRNKIFSDDNTSLTAELKFYTTGSDKSRIIIACMNPDYEYKIMFNGKAIENKKLAQGLYYIYFPKEIREGTLSINKISK